MRYVVDASVALKWVLKEPDSGSARRLRDDFKRSVHDLLAPDTFVAEVGHALTRAERKGIIQPPMAEAFFGDILSTPPDFHPFVLLMPRAMELSSKMRIGVYDSLYIALCEREKSQVITADQRILSVFPAHAISLDSLP